MALATIASAAVASASTLGRVAGTVENGGSPGSITEEGPNFGLKIKRENTVGGDGAGAANMDFSGGKFGIHTHGCVAPKPIGFLQSDYAIGEARSRVTNERFDVVSDDLANGTAVTLTICVDVTSKLNSSVDDPSTMINANGATNVFSWSILASGGTSAAGGGLHGYTNRFASVTANGEFAGVSSLSAHVMRHVDIQARVGGTVTMSFDLQSSTTTTARVSLGSNLVAADAGIGLTAGILDNQSNVSLVSQTYGFTFVGTCGGSGGVIPPNPHLDVTPEPGTFALMGVLPAAWIRTRRKRQSEKAK